MSGKFVRSSKFRHVYGQPVKRELCYDHVRLTKNAWDSNLVKVNPKYISVNWDASGGGAFAVIPLSEVGKLPDKIPLFRGHTAAVLDTDWNPFDDSIVASASDDGKIGIWKVPEGYSVKAVGEDVDDVEDVSPVKFLTGHSKKVGHVQFHPVAKNILASSSGDYTVKIWDIEEGKVLYTLPHKDLITSFSFNYDGSLLATASRDKKLRVWDIRNEKIVSEGPGHAGAKSSRVVWLGDTDRLATTGFSRMSDRQLGLWNATDIASGPIGNFIVLDSSAGICIPFYDEGTKCLYLAGKGDGNIRYFEFVNDEFFALSEYQSIEPQRGMGFLPRRALDVKQHEVVRIYKMVNDSLIEPVQFFVPRRADTFQDDIYPDARASEPALTGEEWIAGKNSDPKCISLADVFEGKVGESFIPERKEEVKEEVVEKPKEVKQLPKELPEASTPVTPSTPRSIRQDDKDIFASKDVSEFLAKSNENVEEEEKEDTGAWNEEDDDVVVVREEKFPGKENVSVKKEVEEPTPVAAKEEEPTPVAVKEQEPVKPATAEAEEPVKPAPTEEEPVKPAPTEKEEEPIKSEPVKERSKPVKDEAPSTSVNGTTHSPLYHNLQETLAKHGVDKTVATLVDHVTKLTSTVESLILDVEKKHSHIQSLEAQLEALKK